MSIAYKLTWVDHVDDNDTYYLCNLRYEGDIERYNQHCAYSGEIYGNEK